MVRPRKYFEPRTQMNILLPNRIVTLIRNDSDFSLTNFVTSKLEEHFGFNENRVVEDVLIEQLEAQKATIIDQKKEREAERKKKIEEFLNTRDGTRFVAYWSKVTGLSEHELMELKKNV